MAKVRAAEERAPMVEELHFRSDNAFLCLLVNRRMKTIRVIDFRAGALPAKRLFIQSIAKREGIEKVITLVEKDEVSSWTRVGFVREGQIPGFYKRSDGHLVGCVVGDRTASIEVSDEGVRLAERTIAHAKKTALDLEAPIRGVTLQELESEDAFEARDQVWARGYGLSGFDAFGRGAARLFVEATPKKGKANVISAEFQDCFGHALIEILRSTSDAQEVSATIAGLRLVSDDLKARGIISAFGFGPSDDVTLSHIYLSAGFRKTGLLARGIQIGNERKDAILWTRKLSSPGGEDLPLT